jgi:hypothetical protein
MKKFLLTIFLALGAVTLLGQNYLNSDETLNPMPPKVPQKMTFAGQTIEFNRSDLIERMDRELLSFTYSHQVSLLMLKRGDRIFRQVVPILNEYGIPEDLKYLMVIESNLDPKARSGAGAAGLWQFMPATAREYGLEVSGEVDERYNIEKETRVACQYLQKAYAEYKDWFTVAASYNSGQGGTTRRLSDQRQTSGLDLWLPTETSRYMFRMLAAKMLFEDPKAFGFNWDPSMRYPYYEPQKVVEVDYSISSLVDFADRYGISYMQLKEANLWLRSNKLNNSKKKIYKIIIPKNI